MQKRETFRATYVSLRIVSIIGILLATMARAMLAGPADEAKQIAALAGFHGGLVVHVGCGDGELTAALRLADNCVVQGLETDAKRVDTARTAIRATGLYGPVSVIHGSGKKLTAASSCMRSTCAPAKSSTRNACTAPTAKTVSPSKTGRSSAA